MRAEALAEIVAALEAAGCRTAVRSGDITPPVFFVELGQSSDLGAPLSGGGVATFWVYYIPVRGLGNTSGDCDAIDALYAALSPLAAAELVTTKTSVTISNDTWPCYRADLAVMALTLETT